jgi:diaminopimelate epimerase
MKKIDFVKVVASGNDFIIIDKQKEKLAVTESQLPALARKVCLRKKSIGADGVLMLEHSNIADVKMRVFNPDGGEVEMCGNGARCVALWTISNIKYQISKIKIETKAGVLEAEVIGSNRVRLKMSEPKDIRVNFNLEVDSYDYRASFVNTGVPHVVCFVKDLNNFDVKAIGQAIRYHKKFKPAGTNVDFVRILDEKNLEIRTYERGVEDETLACGTGAVASAIISVYRRPSSVFHNKERNTEYGIRNTNKINVHTRSGEILRVYFNYQNDRITNVWLEGEAKIVYEGRFSYV